MRGIPVFGFRGAELDSDRPKAIMGSPTFLLIRL